MCCACWRLPLLTTKVLLLFGVSRPSMCRSPFVALKALPAGQTSTSPWSTKTAQAGADTSNTAQAAATGKYIFYTDPNGLAIGYQSPPAGAANFSSVQDCATACDFDESCAGWVILPLVRQSKVATTCRLIRGDDTTGRFKRTLIRTDADHVGFPAAYLCPSGTIVTEGSTTCTPITTMQQATLVMKASGGLCHMAPCSCMTESPCSTCHRTWPYRMMWATDHSRMCCTAAGRAFKREHQAPQAAWSFPPSNLFAQTPDCTTASRIPYCFRCHQFPVALLHPACAATALTDNDTRRLHSGGHLFCQGVFATLLEQP